VQRFRDVETSVTLAGQSGTADAGTWSMSRPHGDAVQPHAVWSSTHHRCCLARRSGAHGQSAGVFLVVRRPR